MGRCGSGINDINPNFIRPAKPDSTTNCLYCNTLFRKLQGCVGKISLAYAAGFVNARVPTKCGRFGVPLRNREIMKVHLDDSSYSYRMNDDKN